MPYRRLPNTDKARLRAMEKAYRKCLSEGVSNCAVSEFTNNTLELVLPKFQNALINLDAARKNQIDKNKDYIEILKKARMYVSHFIQVLNFSMVRGELKSEIRDMYGLSACTNSLPSLNTEKELLDWGKKVIGGEQKRVQNGGNPIYNPSIALVKVNYEKFTDAFHYQKNLISTSKRASKLVTGLRSEADNVILQIWNEVEQAFSDREETMRRENASEYGVSYVFRKREKLKALESIKPQPVEKKRELKVEDINEKANEIRKSVPVQSTINF